MPHGRPPPTSNDGCGALELRLAHFSAARPLHRFEADTRALRFPDGDAELAARDVRCQDVSRDGRGDLVTPPQRALPALKRNRKRAGLRHIGWHVARHSFASHFAMCGVPLKAIQELMGHTTIQMTMRYAHLAPEIARDAVQLLDRRSQLSERGSSVAASR